MIETHKLWSSHPQSIIDHFIPRTLDVPLQILDYNYSAWDVLQSNSRRLCRYILAVDAAPPASLSRTPISLPALECLSITNLGRWTSRHGIFDPLSLFAPEMPSLRRLLFRGVSSWTNLGFTGLTHLALCESHYPAVNVHQFLDLLRSCPLLESLVLRRWLPTEFRKGLHHNGLEVCLDQLSQLTVNHASMDSVMSLLSHLTLPPTVSVLITVEECLTDGINFSTIPSSVPSLGDKSTILIMRPGTSFEIEDTDDNEYHVLISAYNEGCANQFMFIARHSYINTQPLDVPGSVTLVLSMINPSHVQNLFLDSYAHLDLVAIFQLLPSVKVYSFDYCDYNECLLPQLQGDATQSLETIRIIFEPGYSKTDDAEGLNNDRFIHDLEEMVTHRAENGQQLKAVYLDIIQEPGLEEDHTVWD